MCASAVAMTACAAPAPTWSQAPATTTGWSTPFVEAVMPEPAVAHVGHHVLVHPQAPMFSARPTEAPARVRFEVPKVTQALWRFEVMEVAGDWLMVRGVQAHNHDCTQGFRFAYRWGAQLWVHVSALHRVVREDRDYLVGKVKVRLRAGAPLRPFVPSADWEGERHTTPTWQLIPHRFERGASIATNFPQSALAWSFIPSRWGAPAEREDWIPARHGPSADGLDLQMGESTIHATVQWRAGATHARIALGGACYQVEYVTELSFSGTLPFTPDYTSWSCGYQSSCRGRVEIGAGTPIFWSDGRPAGRTQRAMHKCGYESRPGPSDMQCYEMSSLDFYVRDSAGAPELMCVTVGADASPDG